jgi:hypothetical protein
MESSKTTDDLHGVLYKRHHIADLHGGLRDLMRADPDDETVSPFLISFWTAS